MCLSKIKNQGYKIADKDLYTIKFLKKGLIAPFQNFEYELNKLYSIRTTPWWGYFSSQMHRGFHSINGMYPIDYDIVVACRIPIGSKYHIGLDGDVISNKIEIIKIIDTLPKVEWWKGRLKWNLKYIYETYPDNNLIPDEIKEDLKIKQI